MFLLDYSSAIPNIDDVILSFEYFSLAEFILELGTEKPFKRLKSDIEVSQQECYPVRLSCAPPSDGSTHKAIPYSPLEHPRTGYLIPVVL